MNSLLIVSSITYVTRRRLYIDINDCVVYICFARECILRIVKVGSNGLSVRNFFS